MNESEMQLFIREHGESASSFADQALRLGYIYIFPEPNFGVAEQAALRNLMRSRSSWANYVADFKVFRKPMYRGFSKNSIRRDEINFLFEFSKNAYPDSSMAWATLGETSWDEIAIFRKAQAISHDDFRDWLANNLLTNLEDRSQQDELTVVLNAILPGLGNEAYQYCMVDDNNENCDFAPYFFIGKTLVVMIARKWEL
ncbi:hypothetical protein ACQ4M3_28285 [Leptolyngbya sp. AN03gr2]|uniref:hypothetical protein n=1 Tax=unclassified Leptolyngbya TaxID=2650499 RepID=UPI003D3183D7